ncbi:protocadherin beta-16-like [Polymixia lowei]
MRRQVLLFISVLSLSSVVGQVSYSIPEEMAKGSLVGNIAQDLGLDLNRLKSGKARIYTGDSTALIELDKERGVLLIKEKIDREALCGQTTPCALHFQITLEEPIEYYSVTVEINDINDNAPIFKKDEMKFRISESAVVGAKFVLERAMDLDVGMNGLQSYSLKPTDHFRLKLQNQHDGSKKVEMVLQKLLDREKQEHVYLTLTATDGGEPQLSGTIRIEISVLDVNDNAPVFTQEVYKAIILETALKGTVLSTVSATDADQGSNGKVSYSLTNTLDDVPDIFEINEDSGVVVLNGKLDYEKARHYQIHVQASDDGGLTDSCKIIVDVTDMNDNPPSINIMSKTNAISEDSKPGTVVTIINIQDPDSGENGKVTCNINEYTPFTMKSTSKNFFSLVTDNELDRERASEYNISVTCSDEGVPSLSSSVTLTLQISDVNDNAPVFERSSYEAYIVENNTPGLSIFTMKARDADWNQNARVSYILEDSSVNGVPVSSYVSVSAESGVIHAVRSFDYEQIKDFQFCVKAQDGGSPPLSSNVTVKILIQDQNDNAPQVLYPVQTGGSLVAEMVPRSADVGYLVTKVVAVDVDSGQNAWLSYKLQKATDRALFEVGLQNGEIRTIRQVTDKDVVKQRLTVVVEDNGQPSRSATVNVNVAVADSFPEVLSEFTDFTHDKEYNDNLTFYLVLALAVVSFLFITCLVVIISVKIYRWRQSRVLYHSSLPVIPYYPPRYSDTLGTGTLQHVYNYEVCRTTDSRKSDCKFGGAGSQNILIMDPIDVVDMNDNKPTINIMSKSNVISEDSKPNTVVTMINVQDPDSNENGEVRCFMNDNIPFIMKSTSNNFYSLVTDGDLDRERASEYNISVTCSDEGVPSLSSSVTLTLQISDVNDNAPVFEKSSYEAYIVENNTPGLSIFTVKAIDADWNQNARVSYILEDSSVNGVSVSSYVSVSADSGVIHAVRSFDYEQIKDFQFYVKAQDGGSPPLSNNVTVKILIQDQNDNAPQVLYPVQTGGSLVAEMVPRSADAGYLVTKVVAVDVDSGQNAWLSYKLQKATDRALFEVGVQNGEIRTIRQVTDKDVVKQRLTVVVEDNGQPSRSATVNVNVAVADSFPEVLSEFTDFTHDKEYNDNLTFYLVLALAVVSFLFITCLVVIISVKIYRWRQSRVLYHSSLPVIPYYPPRYSDTLGTGTLQHVYNYEVCRTTDSRKSDCKFGGAGSQNILIMDPSSTGTMQRIQSEKNILDEPASPLEVRLPYLFSLLIHKIRVYFVPSLGFL